jgi:hypothetical protein
VLFVSGRGKGWFCDREKGSGMKVIHSTKMQRSNLPAHIQDSRMPLSLQNHCHQRRNEYSA